MNRIPQPTPPLAQGPTPPVSFRAIVELSDAAFAVVDAQAVVRYVSPAIRRVLGYTPEEVVGRSGMEFVVEGDLESAVDLTSTVTNEETGTLTMDARIRRKDGSACWVECHVAPLPETPDGPLFVVQFRDVTTRKEAELDLARRMAHLRAMDRIAETMEQTLDVEAAMQRVLEVVLEVFDCDRAWLVEPLDPDAAAFRIPFIAVRPEWPPGLPADAELPMNEPARQILRAAVSAAGPVWWDDRQPMPDADLWREQFGIRAQMLAALRPRGRAPWGLGLHHCRSDRLWSPDEVALLHDVASRAGDMLGNLLLHRDLRRSEEHFRSLADAIPQILYIHSPDGRCLQCNERWYDYTGLDAKGTLGYGWVQALHPEDRTRAEPTWRDCHRTGATFQDEIRLRRADGTYRWFLNRAVPVRDADGSIQRWVGTCTDIHEQRQAEEAVRHSQEQLRQAQKMEAIGRLAGGVAHDFNNLLTAINGYAEVLLEEIPAGDPKRPSVEEIRRAGERAAALTGQLLAFSRKQVLAPRVVQLDRVVADLERLLRRLIGEDVTLVTENARDLWPIRADPGQIEQVILNLVLNARDAMPRGGRLTIRAGNETVALDDARTRAGVPVGDYVELVIADTGKGMDAETRAHLFEPFFTTKEQGKGTGLGLATAYGILQQSHASILVDTEPGRGTAFHLFFPRVRPEPQPAAEERQRLAGPGGHETILLVEDEVFVRRFVRGVLETLGYRVLEAASGEEALALAGRTPEHIDLLLTDVVMPGMSGREVAERLLLVRRDTKVLYMSGYTDDAVVRHGVETSQAAYVGKPFTTSTLALRLRQVLEG